MIRKLFFPIVLLAFLSNYAFAHTPFCSCFDNGDGTVSCDGGFSDGSSGEGVSMKVIDKKTNSVLIQGKMNEDSEFTFKKPKMHYVVIFDAGPMHIVEVDSKDIIGE